jgi:hypothetical protein
MPPTICGECKLEIRNERFVKIPNRSYHGRCWERRRASATKIKNDLSPDGDLLCPTCSLAIRTGDGTAFREGYAVHVACVP